MAVTTHARGMCTDVLEAIDACANCIDESERCNCAKGCNDAFASCSDACAICIYASDGCIESSDGCYDALICTHAFDAVVDVYLCHYSAVASIAYAS